jgi:hypothetical protein
MAKGNRTKHRRKRGGAVQALNPDPTPGSIDPLSLNAGPISGSMDPLSLNAGPMDPLASTPGSNMESRLKKVENRLNNLESKGSVNIPNLTGGGIPEALDQYLGLKGGQRLGWSIDGELPSEIAFGGSRRRRYKRTGKRGRRNTKRGGDALSDLLKKSGGVT